ncbi:hypothetical protein MPSI1_003594 [Malassezia psittaci]|uniref:DH domain-containing protein n=1 Tax=Malassezia psittaci TaxID=1821823 RepID=A0AAF0F9R8_9BASI|nr:hypothetical protein MPSI1_003594 [Malassezia psittaci]
MVNDAELAVHSIVLEDPPLNFDPQPKVKKQLVVFDFDWTFADQDTDRWVHEVLSPRLRLEFVKRKPTMQFTDMCAYLLQELHKEGHSRADVEDALRRMPLHPAMIRGVRTLQAKSTPNTDFLLLSNSNEVYIQTILKHNQLLDPPLFKEIITNPAHFEHSGLLNLRRRIAPDQKQHACKVGCSANMCKGDGGNDYCPVLRLDKNDIALVRRHRGLAKRILEEGQVQCTVRYCGREEMNRADAAQGGVQMVASNGADTSGLMDGNDKRRANPLSELITTEGRYVTELSMIIRRVAGAWSPSNFPPSELDAMFRAVESVYRTNNHFLQSLQEIGPNPESPKGLGNLLMQWIQQLESPYRQYCAVYLSGLDNWTPIKNNPNLPSILAQVTREVPPLAANGASTWSLDGLFGLPIARLRFYKKLYSRLLRSTQPGRSDHDLLADANRRLDMLLSQAHQRPSLSSAPTQTAPALQSTAQSGPPPGFALTTGSSSPADASGSRPIPAALSAPISRATPPTSGSGYTGSGSFPSSQPASSQSAPLSNDSNIIPSAQNGSANAHAQNQPQLNGNRPIAPNNAPALSWNANSTANLQPAITSMPVASSTRAPPAHTQAQAEPRLGPVVSPMDLRAKLTASISSQSVREIQQRINSTYTIDIFTMQPKSCRLQIDTPTLPFERKLRLTDGGVMHIRPTTDAQPRIVNAARLILLTDLVLIGEDVVSSPNQSSGTQDVWLMFPPLSGKFIEASSHGDPRENVVRLLVMKRAEILVYLPNDTRKQAWLNELRACNNFGLQRTQSNASKPLTTQTNRSEEYVRKPIPNSQSSIPSSHVPNTNADSAPTTHALPSATRANPPAQPDASRDRIDASANQPNATPSMPGGFFPMGTSSTDNARSNPTATQPTVTAAQPPSQQQQQQQQQQQRPRQATAAPNHSTAQPAQQTGMPSPMQSSSPPNNALPAALPAALTSRLQPQNSAPNSSAALMNNGQSTNRAGHTNGLPPLLLPTQTTNEALPGVPVSEQDPGLSSPTPTSAHLTRENSMNSIDSFPRVAAAPQRRADTPELPMGSPLNPAGAPVSSPSRSTFPKNGSGNPAGVNDSFTSFSASPLATQFPNSPFAQGLTNPGGNPRRPSEPNTALANLPMPLRSQSQPRLEGLGSIKPPSQMLQEGGRQNSPDWLNEGDVPRPATAQDNRRPSFNLCAQMRCKVFLKQSYAQWKSLGSARLRLYHLQPGSVNQLVVQNEKKLIISTIVLPDAVERVGKTGLAVEISDNGRLTGVVYMLHMRSEDSASGLFGQLLAGSSRTTLPSPTVS